MDRVLPLVALALLLSAGWGCAAPLLKSRREVPWCELLGLSLLLGVSSISFLWWLSAFFLTPQLSLTAVSCLAVGSAGWAARSWRRTRPRLTEARLLLVLLAATCLAAWLLASTRIEWDGLFIWQIKTVAFATEGKMPWLYLHDASRVWSHPNYPLLVPLNRLWFVSWLPLSHQGVAKLSDVVFFIGALGLILGTVRRWGRLVSWLTAGLFVLTPAVVVGVGSLSSGYADFPLAVYYFAAILYLVVAADEAAPSHSLWLAGALAAALPWTKLEGKVLWLAWFVLAVALSWFSTGRRRSGGVGGAGERHHLAIAALPGVIVGLAWASFLAWGSVLSASVFHPFTIAHAVERMHLVDDIVRSVGRILAAPTDWGLLWLLFFLSMGIPRAAAGPGAVPSRWLLTLSVLLPLPAYASIYLFTRWPLALHIENSFARLLLHLSLPAMLFVAMATTAVWRRLAQGSKAGGPDPSASPE